MNCFFFFFFTFSNNNYLSCNPQLDCPRIHLFPVVLQCSSSPQNKAPFPSITKHRCAQIFRHTHHYISLYINLYNICSVTLLSFCLNLSLCWITHCQPLLRSRFWITALCMNFACFLDYSFVFASDVIYELISKISTLMSVCRFSVPLLPLSLKYLKNLLYCVVFLCAMQLI